MRHSFVLVLWSMISCWNQTCGTLLFVWFFMGLCRWDYVMSYCEATVAGFKIHFMCTVFFFSDLIIRGLLTLKHLLLFFPFMWPCIVKKLFLIKPTDALISQIYFVKKLYMFRTVPLPIIRSFTIYIRHWYMSCIFDDIYQCWMYIGKLLNMGRGTAWNM